MCPSRAFFAEIKLLSLTFIVRKWKHTLKMWLCCMTVLLLYSSLLAYCFSFQYANITLPELKEKWIRHTRSPGGLGTLLQMDANVALCLPDVETGTVTCQCCHFMQSDILAGSRQLFLAKKLLSPHCLFMFIPLADYIKVFTIFSIFWRQWNHYYSHSSSILVLSFSHFSVLKSTFTPKDHTRTMCKERSTTATPASGTVTFPGPQNTWHQPTFMT